MKARFWGVRGSIPTPLPSEQIEHKIVRALLGAGDVDLTDEAAVRAYVASLPVHERGCWGGNTTCVQVTSDAGDTIIIDAGSGLRGLGDAMLDSQFGRGEGYAAMLFTHTHWDHIQGLPFFRPFYVKGNRFDIFARHEDIHGRLKYQHDFRFFPVGMEVMAAEKNFHLMPDELHLFDDRMQVTAIALDHPGVAYAYRIEADGHAFVMASDAEYRELSGEYWDKYVNFYRGADVLVFDAQYTLREALVEKQNWGHSSAMIGIDLATEAGVGTIVMVHHEPSYDDDKIKRIFDDSLRYLDRMPSTVRPTVLVGYEGLMLEL
ncbi:MAG: MBL fold metallo-hydrolase [Fimbriimonadaceae bacterium]|nr:MBL fold metallo-hydrolase [Fimbriimonadaceae bacterium]